MVETALKVLTSNPARILKLKQKGNIAIGLDADVLLLDEDLKINSVFALGVQVIENGLLLKKGLTRSRISVIIDLCKTPLHCLAIPHFRIAKNHND